MLNICWIFKDIRIKEKLLNKINEKWKMKIIFKLDNIRIVIVDSTTTSSKLRYDEGKEIYINESVLWFTQEYV